MYQNDRPMYDATCSKCGQSTQVPFEPKGDRPVYCMNCYKEMRGQSENRGGGDRGQRKMYDATCAGCNQPTQVPFQPKGDRPVYCYDCYKKQKSTY